jgi:SAM-dependent methyltransferase
LAPAEGRSPPGRGLDPNERGSGNQDAAGYDTLLDQKGATIEQVWPEGPAADAQAGPAAGQGAMFHPQGPTFWELAVQALSSTQRGYDLLAPKFDYTPFRTPDGILDRIGEHLRGMAPFAAGLDVCCGTGAAMRVLRPLCRHLVVGLDFSAGMLAEARRRTADAPGTAALAFVRADALAMPFAAAFDVAVCLGALGHISRKDEGRFVGQVRRMLRPGGRFVFVTAYPPPWWSAGHWVMRAFNGAMWLE